MQIPLTSICAYHGDLYETTAATRFRLSSSPRYGVNVDDAPRLTSAKNFSATRASRLLKLFADSSYQPPHKHRQYLNAAQPSQLVTSLLTFFFAYALPFLVPIPYSSICTAVALQMHLRPYALNSCRNLIIDPVQLKRSRP